MLYLHTQVSYPTPIDGLAGCTTQPGGEPAKPAGKYREKIAGKDRGALHLGVELAFPGGRITYLLYHRYEEFCQIQGRTVNDRGLRRSFQKLATVDRRNPDPPRPPR